MKTRGIIVLVLLALSLAEIKAQKKAFNIVLSCTEYVGDGQLRAHFGYDNPSKKTLVINENGSVVTYNHGQAKKLGLSTFEPGLKEKAFYIDFNAKDRVQWTVTLPNGKVKTTDADIHSNHCVDIPEGLDIIPGYLPPEGGKEYNSRIGAELTSLYKAWSYDPLNFDGATDAVFQLDDDKVLIEVVAESGQFSGMISSLEGRFCSCYRRFPPEQSHRMGRYFCTPGAKRFCGFAVCTASVSRGKQLPGAGYRSDQ